jgi:hypothetical protein
MSNNTPAESFLSSHQLGFNCEEVGERPGQDNGWARGSRHWKYDFRTLSTDATVSGYYSQGPAICEDPTAAGVLECLRSDAQSFECAADVLDFASEFGYSLDNEEELARVREVFAACKATFDDLGTVLGESGRDELMGLDFDAEPESSIPLSFFEDDDE